MIFKHILSMLKQGDIVICVKNRNDTYSNVNFIIGGNYKIYFIKSSEMVYVSDGGGICIRFLWWCSARCAK